MDRTRETYSQQTRFVSDASHELRTPIAVIKGYTDMLDRWGKNDETVLNESIQAIKTEIDHMQKLVESLLFLARGDNGTTKVNVELISVEEMLTEIVNEYKMIDPNHQWKLTIKDNPKAMGDVALLKQALRILIDNAIKYSPYGEKIDISLESNSSGGATISIQDRGIGIGDEDIKKSLIDFTVLTFPVQNAKVARA